MQYQSLLLRFQVHLGGVRLGVLRPRLNAHWVGQLTWASALTCGAIALSPASSLAAVLMQWQFDPATEQLEVRVSDQVTPRYFLLAEPTRIVLDLPDTELGTVPPHQRYSGAVQQVRVSQFQAGITRIVLELNPGVALAPDQVQLKPVGGSASGGATRWQLRPLIAQRSTAPSIARPTQPAATIPNLASQDLPPAVFQAPQPITVQVPPLQASAAAAVPLHSSPPPVSSPPIPIPVHGPAVSSARPSPLPPARPEAPTHVRVSVPALSVTPPAGPRASNATPPVTPTPKPISAAPIVEFGQPLPGTKANIPSAGQLPVVSPGAIASGLPVMTAALGSSNILLPAGTVVNLRYPDATPSTPEAGPPQPETLVLQDDLYDRAGNLLAVAGTPVTGQFEVSKHGNRFITRSLLLPDRSLSLSAESGWFGGNPTAGVERGVHNSVFGALAGALVTGLAGGNLLAGAAAGAAVTYIATPKPAGIQPGQTIPVRLTTDLLGL